VSHCVTMPPNPQRQLKLGDELDGTVLKSNGGRRFLLKSPGVPRGWKVELHTRRPEQIVEGGHVHVWVAKISPLQGEVLVQDGEFGRLPVSDAMRPRYVAGLKALLGEAEATAEALADVRTMFVQVTKRQSADWLTVWRILDEPTTGDAKTVLAAIDAVRTARKEAPDELPAQVQKVVEKYGSVLRKALRRLEAA